MSGLPGLNFPADMRLAPQLGAGLGARVLRVVLLPGVDLNPWIDDAHERGLSALGVIANESLHDGDENLSSVQAARLYAARYGDTLEYLQVGNEPDHVSASSWTMSPETLNHLMMVFGVEFPDTPIICGGMADGRPEYLDALDPDLYDLVGVHPYGQRPDDDEDWSSTPGNFGNVQELLPRYVQHSGGKRIAITEVGVSTREVSEAFQARYIEAMVGTLRAMPEVEMAIVFCADDEMVPEFGLFRADGSPKPSAAAFMRATRQEEEVPVMALPIPVYQRIWQAHLPDAEFHPTFGIEKFWMAEDRWKQLGAVTDLGEYREGRKAWRTFVGGAIEWDDSTGAKIA